MTMKQRMYTLALGAVLALGAPGLALAQVCPPGYNPQGATCYAAAGPVEGAANLALGSAKPAAGASGRVVETAGAITGQTAAAVTDRPRIAGADKSQVDHGSCGPGAVLYQGNCFPDPNR
jgi:hypothetical protein